MQMTSKASQQETLKKCVDCENTSFTWSFSTHSPDFWSLRGLQSPSQLTRKLERLENDVLERLNSSNIKMKLDLTTMTRQLPCAQCRRTPWKETQKWMGPALSARSLRASCWETECERWEKFSHTYLCCTLCLSCFVIQHSFSFSPHPSGR